MTDSAHRSIGDEGFCFSCHDGRDCFGTCCRKVELLLYPVDLIRLKKSLSIHSEEFLRRYCYPAPSQNAFFPSLFLRMTDTTEKTCPFLAGQFCSVYAERPASCRMYPLERAVSRVSTHGSPREEKYFLVKHGYCHGHRAAPHHTVAQWLRTQGLHPYNLENELWTDMDTFFSTNPWKGEGAYGPKQQLAFMVCYNIDRFRAYAHEHNLIQQAFCNKTHRRRICSDDMALLHFGYEWLKAVLSR